MATELKNSISCAIASDNALLMLAKIEAAGKAWLASSHRAVRGPYHMSFQDSRMSSVASQSCRLDILCMPTLSSCKLDRR